MKKYYWWEDMKRMYIDIDISICLYEPIVVCCVCPIHLCVNVFVHTCILIPILERPLAVIHVLKNRQNYISHFKLKKANF